MVQIKASEVTGPIQGIVINRWHTLSSGTMSSSRRCSFENSSRSLRRAARSGAMISWRSGTASMSSWIRLSNCPTPTIPTFRPKLRSNPRISFSKAGAFS